MLFCLKDPDTNKINPTLQIDIPLRNLKDDGAYLSNNKTVIPLKDLFFKGAKTADEANYLLDISEIFKKHENIFFINFVYPIFYETENNYFLFAGEGPRYSDYLSNRMLVNEKNARALLNPLVEILILENNLNTFYVNERIENQKHLFNIENAKGETIQEDLYFKELLKFISNFSTN